MVNGISERIEEVEQMKPGEVRQWGFEQGEEAPEELGVSYPCCS